MSPSSFNGLFVDVLVNMKIEHNLQKSALTQKMNNFLQFCNLSKKSRLHETIRSLFTQKSIRSAFFAISIMKNSNNFAK